ncbi:MAG: NAD(P)/FAD-dependent oxidoreductase [Spirochaetota bacterium]
MKIGVLGGGAAGFFAAIRCKENFPQAHVEILEKSSGVLSKVRISGGGRCNVTHNCFDPQILVKYYPRGKKELLGPFHRFQPADMVKWLEKRRVKLKTESDGRMFPISDSSETIIDCFLQESKKRKVVLRTNLPVAGIFPSENGFTIKDKQGNELRYDKLIVATGSNRKVWDWLAHLGHNIQKPVPSLFTLQNDLKSMHKLSGLSTDTAEISLNNGKFKERGPILLTHWGMSGPAVLKLSAFAARYFFEEDYKVPVKINWLAEETRESLQSLVQQRKQQFPKRKIKSDTFLPLPTRLYEYFVEEAQIPPDLLWSYLSKKQQNRLLLHINDFHFVTTGKTIYKDEFVTCGGVSLKEVNFKTMESKVIPGLYFAGEVLDIDGVTGGFNFQNAWTTAWIAAELG